MQRKRGAAKKKPLVRQGRTVVFAGSVFPRFLLSAARLSLGERPGFPRIEASVRDITSDPDLLDRPISIQASGTLDRQVLSLDAMIDPRTRRQNDVEIHLRADNWSMALEEGFEWLRIYSVTGTAGLQTDFTLAPGGDARGEGSIALRNIVVEMVVRDESIGAAVAEALGSIPEATAQFTFTMTGGKAANVSVRTNLDELVSKKAVEQLGRLREELAGRLADPTDYSSTAPLAPITLWYQPALFFQVRPCVL